MMKRTTIAALAAVAALAFLPASAGLAAEAEQIEVVTIHVIPQPTPVPVPVPERAVETHSFEHHPYDIKRLARLLWSSPLRDEAQKEALLWVVLNRVDDETDTFGDSIESVVTTNEFSFYDAEAHLSEENLRIAQEVMDAWQSEAYGFYVGPHVPKNGLYIRFVGENNRQIEVTAERGGEALVW